MARLHGTANAAPRAPYSVSRVPMSARYETQGRAPHRAIVDSSCRPRVSHSATRLPPVCRGDDAMCLAAPNGNIMDAAPHVKGERGEHTPQTSGPIPCCFTPLPVLRGPRSRRPARLCRPATLPAPQSAPRRKASQPSPGTSQAPLSACTCHIATCKRAIATYFLRKVIVRVPRPQCKIGESGPCRDAI